MKKKIRFQQLEVRVMLDAAGLATAVEGVDAAQDSLPDTADQNTDELDSGLVAHLRGDVDGKDSIEGASLLVDSSSLVVVDTTIANFESLIADLSEDTEVLLLDGAEDGLDQIAKHVEGREGITSIHILSNASAGDIQLGNSQITEALLSQQSEQISRIGESLDEEGSIRIYGCDTADDGSAHIGFVSELQLEVSEADGGSDNWGLSSVETQEEGLSFDLSALDELEHQYLSGTGTDIVDDDFASQTGLFDEASPAENEALSVITDFYQAQEGEAEPDVEGDYDLSAVLETVEDRDLIVVDAGVEDYQSLLKNLPANAEVLLLDADGDGLQQLLDFVDESDGFASIHILTHGNSGRIFLGETYLSAENINNYSQQLSALVRASVRMAIFCCMAVMWRRMMSVCSLFPNWHR